MASRVDELCRVEEMEEELRWLRRHGTYASLSFYPLRRDEVRKLPLLFLDLTEEAVILYDKDRFLEAVLLELKAELLRQGARRVEVGDGR